jgi:hypothetical protein
VYARLRRGTSVYGVDGAIEVSLLRGAAGDEVLLSLWPTLAEAAADPGAEWYEVHSAELRSLRSRGDRPLDPMTSPTCAARSLAGARDLRCSSGEDISGRSRRAEFAAVVLFGGPLWAPVRFPHPVGTSRALTLWQPERLKQAVVLLAASAESLVDFAGPVEADRVDLYQVLSVYAGCPR